MLVHIKSVHFIKTAISDLSFRMQIQTTAEEFKSVSGLSAEQLNCGFIPLKYILFFYHSFPLYISKLILMKCASSILAMSLNERYQL